MDPLNQPPPAKGPDQLPDTLGGAVRDVIRHPLRRLFGYWNWKAAVLSAVGRTSIFFTVNLTASWDSAVDAAVTEMAYRGPMVGTLASLSQAFRRVQPAWQASLVIMFLLPALGHAIEFAVHSLRGTEKLYTSVAASVAFSTITCLLSYLLHRRDILVVGHGARPFWDDIVELPVALFDLLVRKPARGVQAALGGGVPPRDDS